MNERIQKSQIGGKNNVCLLKKLTRNRLEQRANEKRKQVLPERFPIDPMTARRNGYIGIGAS